MTIDQAIETVENALNIKLSDEQKAVLRADPNKAILTNACAGSGKTTLYLISIITRALTGMQNPANVLGVTFSKKAQTDMEKRYNIDCTKLANVPSFSNLAKPRFSTFHALFYQLLRSIPQYNYVQVLSSYSKYYFELSKQIDLSKTELSAQEYLTQIFDTQSALVNMTFSFNGLDLNPNNKIVKMLAETEQDSLANLIKYAVRFTFDENFIDNYKHVISLYEQLKQENGYIDFNDMKVKLLDAIHNDQNTLMHLRQQMSKYQQIYIDEFQDIDPLQWVILKQLTPKSVFDHLFVIGDDDQNVYSFRGSSVYYILNFNGRLMNNAITLNLSTNYRTGGNILAVARGLIEKNTARLGKELKAFNNETGNIYIYTGVDINAPSDFFNKMFETVKNPKSNTALLVRLNRDKTLIADKLATQGYYTNVTQTSLILQNQTLYKAAIALIDSILNGDVREYIEYSNKIGFSRYKNLLKEHYKDDIEFDKLLKKSLADAEMAQGMARDKVERWSYISIGRAIRDTASIYYQVQKNKTDPYMKHINQAGLVFDKVRDLMKHYIDYMVKKQIYSENASKTTMNYIGSIVSNAKSWDEFLQQEQIKKRGMEDKIKEEKQLPNFQILSEHQSKGLEFDDVFILGLGGDLITKDDYQIWKLIPAKYDLKDFVKWIYDKEQSDPESFYKLMYSLYQNGSNIAKRALGQIIGFDPRRPKFDEYLNHFNKQRRVFPPVHILFTDHDTKIMFYDVNHVSSFVEDERRLLYVAMTRAKKNAYLAYPTSNASPLATEILNTITSEQENGTSHGVHVENNEDPLAELFEY